jgi:hypothetical protein
MQSVWVCPAGRQVLLAALLFIAGCVQPVVVRSPTAETPLQADEGAVVVSITGNTARVSQFGALFLKDQQGPEHEGGREYRLTQNSEGLARDTSLFVGTVPAGEYVFSVLGAADGQKLVRLNQQAALRIGAFRVKAGAASDLGRLVVTGLNGFVIVGRSERVRSNAELVKRFVPESAGIYSGPVNEGWLRPRDPSDRVEEYALQAPVGVDGLTELPKGWAVAASRLGTLLLRNPTGSWRTLHSDGLESLLWVKPSEDGSTLLAAGELNTLLRFDRNGRTVRLDPGNLPPGNLLFLDGNDSAGWYVAHRHDADVTVFRSATLERGDWRPLKTESVERSHWSGENNFWIWSTKEGFAYAVSAGRIERYHFASQQWTRRSAPNDARFLGLAPHPGDTLGALTSPGGGFGGIFATVYLSPDGGATWQEIDSPFKVKSYPPYLTPEGTLLLLGGYTGNTRELQRSMDMGKTWQPVTDTMSSEEKIIVLPTAGVFRVSAGQQFGFASIQHSRDGGASWKTEYSNFDRAAYEAQKKEQK